jgi:hypothetical protein
MSRWLKSLAVVYKRTKCSGVFKDLCLSLVAPPTPKGEFIRKVDNLFKKQNNFAYTRINSPLGVGGATRL